MKSTAHTSDRERGAALVVTLIVCVVLSTVVVALIQSTTRDRYSSASVANYYRAQLAAESGLAAASALLDSQMANDHFIVVANTSTRQLFVGTASNQTPQGTVAYRPAFCFSTSLSNVVAVATNTNSVNTVRTATLPGYSVPTPWTNFTITNMASGATVSSPNVAWIYLTNVVTNAAGAAIVQTNARFTFWIEDLGGKLDLSVVGVGSSTDTNARRPTGTNPAELALWSLFNPASPSDPGNAVSTDLVNARNNSKLPTPATARLVSPSVTSNQLSSLSLGLRHDTNEPDLIPFGLGYTADQGKPKYNLNTNTNGVSSVTALAAAINGNLPNFSQRSGAMNPAAYVNGIAASIIDYADTNNVPTVDNPANPSYSGIENIPWPNELFDRVQFREVTSSGKIRVELTDYLEVWNMGDKDTQPTTITISNNYDMALDFTNEAVTPRVGFSSNLKDATPYDGSQGFGPREFSIPALKPNEYKVVQSSSPNPARKLEWQSPSTNTSWVIFSPSSKETTNMTYKAFVGGTLIQESKGGRWPRHLARTTDGLKMMPSTPNRFIFCNPVGFASQTRPMSQSGVPAHSGGDPRAQLFLSGPLRAANYKGWYSTPGSRNLEYSNLVMRRPPFPESEVNPAKFWPDTGHGGPTNIAAIPTDYTQNPDSFPGSTNTNNFVMRRNDSGAFTNILELGNIYDPMQWADQAGSGIANQPGIWTNLTASATADARFGGRNTLRIGRWEFSKFTNNGTRASQLLDIFAIAPSGSPVVVNSVPGRINLNTADTNALRALAAGVFHNADPGLLPSGTNFVVPVAAVDAFVSAVTNRIAQRPFLSAAELTTLTNATTGAAWPASAIFGNATAGGVAEWNDAAAEEWFAKIYPLATVRSRNFLVYAVGQTLNPWLTNQPVDARVTASVTKLFQVHVQPLRDAATGLTTNCVVRVLWSQEL